MVSTQSSIGTSESIIVPRIFEVKVERIFAFTPLPNPSANTIVKSPLAFCGRISTRSPHSSSPFLLRLTQPVSIKSLSMALLILRKDCILDLGKRHLGLGGCLAQ